MSNFSATLPTPPHLISLQNPLFRQQLLPPSLFYTKTCQRLSPSLLNLIKQDRHPMHSAISGCARSTNLPLTELSDEVIIQQNNPYHRNCTNTSQPYTLNSCQYSKTAHSTATADPSSILMTLETLPDALPTQLPLDHTNRMGQDQDNHLVDLSNLNDWAYARCNANILQCQRNKNQSVVCQAALSQVTFKQPTPSIDKKEMRARRNRESARRSRMKSKQHFQALERSFVFMNKENMALRLLVEKLLSKSVEASPQMKARLQSLFEEQL